MVPCLFIPLAAIPAKWYPEFTDMRGLCTALLLLFILISSSLGAAMGGSAFCDAKCKVRCSKAGAHDRCIKYCGLCCAQCRCVPSGTFGNKDECPCYRDKYTGVGKRRRPKCP